MWRGPGGSQCHPRAAGLKKNCLKEVASLTSDTITATSCGSAQRLRATLWSQKKFVCFAITNLVSIVSSYSHCSVSEEACCPSASSPSEKTWPSAGISIKTTSSESPSSCSAVALLSLASCGLPTRAATCSAKCSRWPSRAVWPSQVSGQKSQHNQRPLTLIALEPSLSSTVPADMSSSYTTRVPSLSARQRKRDTTWPPALPPISQQCI